MSKTLLAESFGQRLLVIFTALSPFYVTLHGRSLLDNAGAYCPEQPHDKGSALYKYPTSSCKTTSKNQQTLRFQSAILMTIFKLWTEKTVRKSLFLLYFSHGF